MRLLTHIVPALLIAGFVSSAAAVQRGTRDEAVAMVHNVQDMFARQGADATFQAINDLSNKQFHDRDLYPFVYTRDGVNLAHGSRPDLVGKNLLNIKDADGKYLIQDIVKITDEKGGGWVDYKWPDPLTNGIENKSSYVEKMGNYVVGVGIYLP
jgi:cytochrome c